MAAPITVHRPADSGGRRVSVRTSGIDRDLGIAHSDADVEEFLRRAGLPEGAAILDDPGRVEWRGGRPHEYRADTSADDSR
ncbi:hypothetical protein ACH4FX_41875 [Streptomyces sp. NPDC018019]|uniref:hypothetical protein n=1 Tax=Streptomyces sp. NPDC018019 TaxID=3365030 RepID=UPI0037B7CB37